MNDNFETPCRQLFGQPWDIFMKTLTQLCNNFERGVYLCPALWVVYSHSLHQKKTLIDLRLISKPPFSEETAGHQGFYWGPPPYLAIGHQAPGTVAQIGRQGRGISLSPSDWRISPNLMALWTKVTKSEGILLFIRLRLKRQRCFFIVLLTLKSLKHYQFKHGYLM